MIKAMLKLLFYASYVFLLGLILWTYSSARSWREIADNAQKARDKTAQIAKVALDRADRCFAEVAKQESVQVEKKQESKPDESGSPKKPGTS